ncbi:HTTM domain-containing protein [Roseivirga sp. UBA838]|uniref:HTTM domain-containing protein n=1 Tax=Roseivirga sp. UBA838 TaxID=1947393 RepID=UPI00257F3DC5|nr:HTTM domain-containing protein [Roseivirga sp. UBA838]
MNWLKSQFQPVDNSPLILFRICFGALVFLECFGATLTGWVKRALIEPEFNFTLIGMEWLQPPDGPWMYVYFYAMSVCGLMIMFGYYYRMGVGLFTILWTLVYWMQKSHYNNHYYLLILLSLFMLIVPAHAYASRDAKRWNSVVSTTCPRWCITIFVVQLWIVFTFAAAHKLYPGWLNGDFIAMNFLGKRNRWLIGPWLQKDWLQQLVIYGGILFDACIVYLLLWKKTRKAAFVLAIVFNLFNSLVFHIGIFPYLMIALMVFFFEPETIRRIFFKKKPIITTEKSLPSLTPSCIGLVALFVVYFAHQLYLPVRHHLYKGDVFYTEEGHRLAWRMMLRYKSGYTNYTVYSPQADSSWIVNPKQHLTTQQSASLPGHPDMIWQFARYLHKKYEKEGFGDVEIRAEAFVSLNKEPLVRLIDPEVDLAKMPWQPLKHSEWILSPDK